MEITVLVDNNTYIDQYFYGEPAVCYYIEAGDQHILFDTGYSDIFLNNAEKLNVDLSGVTHIVLSHGHNDHTGGIRFMCDKIGMTDVKLVAHPHCFLKKYDGDEYIGAPYTEDDIQRKVSYIPSSEPFQISSEFIFLGEIPRKNSFEVMEPIGKQKVSGIWKPDFVKDDSALVYKNPDGIFIITGCSHSGICNIIEYAKKVCQEDRIIGVLGGFHLFEDDERLKHTIEYLENCKMQSLYPCHCVSLKAKSKMMSHLPVEEVGVGMKISLA